MITSISEFYNIKKQPILSLESVDEKLRIAKNALNKINVIKSIRYDVKTIANEMAYVNAVIPNRIKISKEDSDTVIVEKVGEAEKMVNSVISELTEQHDTLVAEQENVLNEEPKQEEPKKEVEPIIKYPLNEKTLTTYSLTTPNLLNAVAVVLDDKKLAKDKDQEPASVVSTAKVLLDDIATRKELVEVAKEEYDANLPIIDNAVKFFNSSRGNKWLLGKEGKQWINYVLYKKNISLEDSSILPQEDYDVFSKEDDEELEAIISMEDANDALIIETVYNKEEEKNVEKDTDETMSELTENVDRISRLEDEMTLVAAGIDNIDDIQANQTLSVESAICYNRVLDRLKNEVGNHIGLKEINHYELAKESIEFDPAGGLTIAREGLVEILSNIYEFFKKLITKVINWIKRYFGKVSVYSKMQTAKAKRLLGKLTNKKELTKDQFDTVQVKLIENYRPILYLMDFDLNNAPDFLQSIVKNPIRKTIQNPLKDVYNVLNKLNSDINNNKKEALLDDAKAIATAMSKDNILKKALANRSKFISKLDKKVEVKKKEEDIVPLICSYKGSHGLVIEESSFGGETLYKYSIQPLTFKTLEGLFKKVPSKNDIKAALTKASLSANDSSLIYKEMEDVIKYGNSFIQSFKKFKKNSWGDSAGSKEVSSAISSIVSYAKSVTIQYVTLEVHSYITNCKGINSICETLINTME